MAVEEHVAVHLTGPHVDAAHQALAFTADLEGLCAFSVSEEEPSGAVGERYAVLEDDGWHYVIPPNQPPWLTSTRLEEVVVSGIDDPICLFLDGQAFDEGSQAWIEWDYGTDDQTIIRLDGWARARFHGGRWYAQDRRGDLEGKGGIRLAIGRADLYAQAEAPVAVRFAAQPPLRHSPLATRLACA